MDPRIRVMEVQGRESLSQDWEWWESVSCKGSEVGEQLAGRMPVLTFGIQREIDEAGCEETRI